MKPDPTTDVDYDYSEVHAAIERMRADGRDYRNISHTLISAGLCHFRRHLCDHQHVIEEFEFVQGWIAKKLAELRGLN
jgi:hypothetical protein